MLQAFVSAVVSSLVFQTSCMFPVPQTHQTGNDCHYRASAELHDELNQVPLISGAARETDRMIGPRLANTGLEEGLFSPDTPTL